MAIAISFDGVSLQTSNIICEKIEHEDVTSRKLNYQKLGRREGAKYVSEDFDVKIIRVSGIIKDTTAAGLEQQIDNLKEVLNRKEKNLDIEYAGGTRRYIASASLLLDTVQEHYHVTFRPFTIEFTVSNPPLGKETDTTTVEYLGLNDAVLQTATMSYNGSFTAEGSYRPRPKLVFTFNSVSQVYAIKFKNVDRDGNESEIIVNRTFNDGEILVIDCDEYKVTVDGTEVDYSGIFPQFSVNGNDFTLGVVGRAYNIDLRIVYYKLWL